METENRKSQEKSKKIYYPETMTSLAAKYKISRVTLRKWLIPIENQINISPRRLFTPVELKIIIEFLGDFVY
ncbi:hypothetical protein [Candidatus Venteria ishoeyi]|uniref:hypothetical protein n=1 Tax=Candidatus Venteria ishoeyi TaxID=1899563 RepID=UPI000CDE7CAC|nr:hypothetical protein [Candidatus Venteria ishoeyi]